LLLLREVHSAREKEQ